MDESTKPKMEAKFREIAPAVRNGLGPGVAPEETDMRRRLNDVLGPIVAAVTDEVEKKSQAQEQAETSLASQD